MRLDPGQSKAVSLPPGKNRLKADMGTILNLRAADAGDEAIFDARLFLPPADAGDIGDILGLRPEALASGWEGVVSYGPLCGRGHLRVHNGQVRLTISGALTPETVPNVLAALEGQGRLWRVVLPGRARVLDGTDFSGAKRQAALRQLALDVTSGVQKRTGVALLASVDDAPPDDAALAPVPLDKARCVMAEMDFAKSRWLLSFVTTAQARAEMETN